MSTSTAWRTIACGAMWRLPLILHCVAVPARSLVLIGFQKTGTSHSLYPDATVSCDPGDRELDNLLIEQSRVVVAVLSLGTEARDRGAKFRPYQLWPGIQDIVLVNQFAPLIEVWGHHEDDPDNVKAWMVLSSLWTRGCG